MERQENKWNIVTVPFYHSKLHEHHHMNEQSTCYLDKLSTDYVGKIEDVKHLLRSMTENGPMESLVLVDAIQRLGMESYFEGEIEAILRQLHMETGDSLHGFYTLHDVSLLFRLFRQHGYHISPDVFKIFKGKDGKFQSKLSQDIKGLMELHEAAQLRLEGEQIIDEAATFSFQLLQQSSTHVGSHWSDLVANNLKHPYHKSIKKWTHKNFRGLNNEWAKTLTELATMDLQKRTPLYHDELSQISKWWNEMGLSKDLKLARNQPLKWFACSMGILADDVSISDQRVELTKAISFIYLIDDIYDLYGTLDELIIFTEAINKWDYDAIDTLPDCMKMCYRSLLDTTNEIGLKIYKMDGFNPIDSLKATWASLCNAFLVEAKWFSSGEVPTAENYLDNGKVSSGAHVVVVHLFFLLGLGGETDLNNISQITSSIATILRLSDDLGSAKDEHQDGRDGSYIECYMKEHQGLSFDRAREHVIHMIEREWKILNKECLCANKFPTSLKKASHNFARMVDIVYSYDDKQQLPMLEEYVKFMLSKETNL